MGTLQGGEIARVRAETAAKVEAETTAKVKAAVTAEGKAEAATKPTAEGSPRQRLKVVLTPGTDLEYASVETTLDGSSRGYEPGKVLTRSNGQRWRVVDATF